MKVAFITRKNILVALSLLCVFVFTVLTLNGTGAYAVFYNKPVKQLPIYSVNTDEKKIAISFDCAWGTDYTDTLLEIMKDEDVKCTFFMVEFWATKHPDYVKKIDEFGHEIGTHSATHPYMSKQSKDTMIKELTTSISAIESVIDKKVTLFRPPYGDYNDLVIETAKELGLYTIQWSVDSLDWKNLSANEIKNRVVSRVKNGSIVLFHNQGLHTSEALKPIILELKAKGYSFVPIGELIYKDNFFMEADGSQTKTK